MHYPIGSMLQRPIKKFKIKIANHIGIYIGNDEVIHFGFPAENKIIKTTMEEFSDGQAISVKQYPDDEEHGISIVRKAKILLQMPESEYNGKYSIFLNNCEDFARECFGKKGHLIRDQWESLRGDAGEKASKTSAGLFSSIATMAGELGKSPMAKNALAKTAGVSARGLIKTAVKSAHSTGIGKQAIEVIAKSSAGKAIYGGAAINTASKVARGNAVVATATTIALTGPDLYRAIFDKSVSWKQVSKNFTTNGAMVAGGVGGWAGGAALGSAIFPGVGTVVGAVAGSLVASSVAKSASKKALDHLHVDDSVQMQVLIEGALIKLSEEFEFTEEQIENHLIPAVKEKTDDVKWMREIYKSGENDEERAIFAYSQCRGICMEVSENMEEVCA